jgi:hypothetical protein
LFEGEFHVEEYVDWKAFGDWFWLDRVAPDLHGP